MSESQSPDTLSSDITPKPSLMGKGAGRLSFEEIDQRYMLKTRAFIKLCMPPVFMDMERRLDLAGMRKDGTVPIMFYLVFETEAQPLAFNGKVETAHTVILKRSSVPSAKGPDEPPVQRLMFDMQIDVHAQAGSGDPATLGGDRGGALVRAGRMRGVHVLSRPVAPQGERQVTQAPPELRGLQEQPWDEPFPSIEALIVPPRGYRELEAGTWQEQRSVWGLQNTDINQHVNVQEYITHLENHFTRMVFGAHLAPEQHRISRTEILFKRPSFRGQAHAMRGRLFEKDGKTMLLGGFYPVDPEGGVSEQPSVFARMEGSLQGY